MSTITFKTNPIQTVGQLPVLGAQAPDFKLTKIDLSDIHLNDLAGQKVVLNIFPSLDTPTCAQSVRHFNQAASQMPNTTVLCVSADLPFAQKRFCTAENLEHVVPVSVFRNPDFGRHYGVTITDSALSGLLSRAIVILDENSKVIYTQQVAELTQEPDYDAALKVLNSQ